MAIYEAPQPASTSGGFGKGIGKALTGLTEAKVQKAYQKHQLGMQREQERYKQGQLEQALTSMNLPKEWALFPESTLNNIIKGKFSQEQARQTAAAKAAKEGNPQDLLDLIMQGQEQEPESSQSMQAFKAPQDEKPFIQQDALTRAAQELGLQKQEEPQKELIPIQKPVSKGPSKEQLAKLTPQQLEKYLQHQAKEKEAQEKRDLEIQKRQDKRQMHWDKETAPVYEDITGKAKVANDSDLRLSRIEELTENGEISSPIFETALNILEEGLPWGMRLNLNALRSADSIELGKLSKDFLKDAKQFFGARVTEGEIRLFLQTIPDLSQTKEGRLRIINNMRMFNELARSRADVMNNIIEENGGERPRGLSSMIEVRMKPKVDDVAKRFKHGIRQGHDLSKTIKNPLRGSIAPSFFGGLDNPMDIINTLRAGKRSIGKRISGLFGD